MKLKYGCFWKKNNLFFPLLFHLMEIFMHKVASGVAVLQYFMSSPDLIQISKLYLPSPLVLMYRAI